MLLLLHKTLKGSRNIQGFALIRAVLSLLLLKTNNVVIILAVSTFNDCSNFSLVFFLMIIIVNYFAGSIPAICSVRKMSVWLARTNKVLNHLLIVFV